MRERSKLKLNRNSATAVEPNAIVQTAVNSARISDNDPYTVLFEGGGQEITNGTRQKDGSYYDIPSLDIEGYNNKIYSDHQYNFANVLGKAIGLVKDVVGNRVTLGGIQFSRKNPNAALARDMLLEGLVEFSTGTLGLTDEDGKRENHRIIDISIVGLGNNDYTAMENSLAAVAAKNGFDLSKYQLNEDNNVKYFVKNTHKFAANFTYKNDAGEDTTVEVPAGGEVEVPNAEVQTAAQKQVDEAQAPAADPASDPTPEPANQNDAGTVTKSDFDALKNTLDTLVKNMSTPAKPSAGAHVDTNNLGVGTTPLLDTVKNMKPGERLYKQIMLERTGQKSSDEYQAINDFNHEQLLSKNALTDDEASVGGLIPPYELLDRIESCTTQYDSFLQQFGFEAAGLSYGWNLLVGDIEFLPVGYCDPSAESDIETALQNRTQERLATHTVICNKVSQFSPANVVNLVASRYQNAYKRALAAFAIAEMQVAVDRRASGLERTDGTDIAADPNASLVYPGTGARQQAEKVLQLFTYLSDCVLSGTYIMNAQTAAKLILDFNLSAQGIISGTGTVQINAYDRLSVALGGNLVVVPNSLMPTLGSGSTVTVPRTSDGGGNVTVDHAIFYTGNDNWQGVHAGGLQFDVDSFGSYETQVEKEVDGGDGTVTVIETRSAKQRGETVLFGEMYRGGGIFDFRKIGGVKADLES